MDNQADYDSLLLKTIFELKGDMHKGFEKMFDLYSEHAKQDDRRFQEVDNKLGDFAVSAAESRGEIKGRDKVWAGISIFGGTVFGIAGDWLLKKIGVL
jgi:hypothetical protein